jgi:putative membrane protein
LQPERTELAWRRTTLALAVGALVALRLLPAVLGSWPIGIGLLGLTLAALLWVLAHHRARRTQPALSHHSRALPGGRLLVFLATLVTATAALALIYVVAGLTLSH